MTVLTEDRIKALVAIATALANKLNPEEQTAIASQQAVVESDVYTLATGLLDIIAEAERVSVGGLPVTKELLEDLKDNLSDMQEHLHSISKHSHEGAKLAAKIERLEALIAALEGDEVEGDALVGTQPTWRDHLAHLNYLAEVLDSDERYILAKDPSYGASWKKRGGPGAYAAVVRHLDRFEEFVEKQHGSDVFKAIREDRRAEGVMNSIRDIRRYMALIECEAVRLGFCSIQRTTSEDPA